MMEYLKFYLISGVGQDSAEKLYQRIDIAGLNLIFPHPFLMLHWSVKIDDDLLLYDIGRGLFLQPGTADGAISILVVQWLCNADKL